MFVVAVMVGGIVVNANSTPQHCVTLSTFEADHVTLAQAVKTVLFTEAVLDLLYPSLVGETIGLFEDSQGAIAMAENPMSGEQTKNIEVRHHFINELEESRAISVQLTESSSQHADILTKSLGLEAFLKHRAFLMNLPG